MTKITNYAIAQKRLLEDCKSYERAGDRLAKTVDRVQAFVNRNLKDLTTAQSERLQDLMDKAQGELFGQDI